MAIYATLKDAHGSTLGTFRWNNRGVQVDEIRSFPLTCDLENPPFFDSELDGPGTLKIDAFASDKPWPDSSNKENDLGSLETTFDPRVPASIGSFMLGPSQTDKGNAGYLVHCDVFVIPDAPVQRARLEFQNLVLHQHGGLCARERRRRRSRTLPLEQRRQHGRRGCVL